MLTLARLFILLFVSCFIFLTSLSPSSAEKAPLTIHAIQFASYPNIKYAEKEFDELKLKINKDLLNDLRIEKVGKYHSVRLGKCKTRNCAEKLANSIRPQAPSFTIVKTRFMEERIINTYRPFQGKTKNRVVQKSLKEIAPETAAMEINQTPAGVNDQKPAPQDASHEVYSAISKRVHINEDKLWESVPLENIIITVSTLVHIEDYSKALEIVKTEIERHPTHPGLNAWYGVVLLKMNQPDQALAYLENAVKLSPETADYRSSLGYCLFFMNKYDDAAAGFQKAVDLEPGHLDALAGLGIIYGLRGELEKAIEIYNILVDLDKVAANAILEIIKKTT